MAGPRPYGPDWSATLRRGTEAELRGWLEAASGWADAADEIALTFFRADLAPERKADRTFVTAADRAIERLIRERIAERFPDHGVMGEEYGEEAGGASIRWYVDPIDGTHGFMRGVPVFATLLAVERDGEMQAAVISAPALGERWHAWRGGGAWSVPLAGRGSGMGDGSGPRRLAVSAVASLGEAHVLTSSASDIERSGRAPGIRVLLARAWRERGYGDFWGYTLVAQGAAEVMVETALSAWDAAAPLLLVEEAGGRATDLAGSRSIRSGTFLATNGRLHDEVLAILSGRDA